MRRLYFCFSIVAWHHKDSQTGWHGDPLEHDITPTCTYPISFFVFHSTEPRGPPRSLRLLILYKIDSSPMSVRWFMSEVSGEKKWSLSRVHRNLTCTSIYIVLLQLPSRIILFDLMSNSWRKQLHPSFYDVKSKQAVKWRIPSGLIRFDHTLTKNITS